MASIPLIQAVQILAMEAVLSDTDEYRMRDICRWYSGEFSTPLHIVEDLPFEYVLQHYYEAVYAKMQLHYRTEAAKLLSEDAAAKRKREADEKKRLQGSERLRERLKAAQALKAQQQEVIKKGLQDVPQKLADLEKQLKAIPLPKAPRRELKQSSIESKAPASKPDIDITFVDQLDEDWDLFGPTKKK